VLQDFAPRAAGLEYWFIKFHAGALAFLVDFIARRPIGQAEVRVSLWVRGQPRTARTRTASWHATGRAVTIGDSQFAAARSVGRVEDIEWDLTYDAGAGRAAPAVPLLSRLHPFDMELISRPCARFSGHVIVGRERFDVADARGSLTHYWGRRLADEWHWISANCFGDTDLTVEAVAMRTRLWGRHPTMAIGFLWTGEAGHEDIVISPLTGLITVAGPVDDYELVARRPGRTTRLRCSARLDCYNDLDEGIHQTLHGSCLIVGRGLTDPQAGLEFRSLPGR
jgi:hypothetical protein